MAETITITLIINGIYYIVTQSSGMLQLPDIISGNNIKNTITNEDGTPVDIPTELNEDTTLKVTSIARSCTPYLVI